MRMLAQKPRCHDDAPGAPEMILRTLRLRQNNVWAAPANLPGLTRRLMKRGMAPLCAGPNQPSAAFFLRQPSRPSPTRPVAKSGRAAGSGTALAHVALPAEVRINAPAEVENDCPEVISLVPVIGPMGVERT